MNKRLRGELVTPSDEYDDARTVWNAMVDRSPTAIVNCAGVADVITAVNLERDHNPHLAIKSGADITFLGPPSVMMDS